MNPYVGGIITITVAIVGPYLGWLAAKRKTSGKISTTEAESLWTASAGFQATVLAEAERLRSEVERLRSDVTKSFEEVLDLRAALSDSQQEKDELRADSHRLRNQIMGMEHQAGMLRAALAEANRRLIEAGMPPVEVGDHNAE